MGVPFSLKLMPALLCVAVLSPPAMVAPDALPRLRPRRRAAGGSGCVRSAATAKGCGAVSRMAGVAAAFDLQRDPSLDRRDDFRRGFADGYRAGYERVRGRASRQCTAIGATASAGARRAATRKRLRLAATATGSKTG